MNKQVFAILAIAVICQIKGMDQQLYPHNYQCKRHHHKGPYPYRITMEHLTNELLSIGEYGAFHVYEAEDRAYDQFVDGHAPLVIARRSFDNRQTQELEALNQQIVQACSFLCKVLGRPSQDGGYLAEKDNQLWRNLKARLANPPSDAITFWVNQLSQRPELWHAVEKIALTANIFSNKKTTYFKNIIIPTVAKFIDAVFFAQSTGYVEQLDEKNIIINQERAAKEQERIQKEAAQRTINDQQRIAQENANALRNLELQRNNLFLTMRQKTGNTLYNGTWVNLEPDYARIITENRDNPPADKIREHEELLSPNRLNNEHGVSVYDLVIKTAQVNPQDAKSLLITLMAHLRFVTANAYASPILERLDAANAAKSRLEEQNSKLQADLEAAQKSKADSETHLNGEITQLRDQKRDLSEHFESNIRDIAQLADQRHEKALGDIQDLRRALSPLRRELSPLRRRVREQEIEIVALRRALATGNQH